MANVPTPTTQLSQRDAAIDLALATIEKQFGKGSIMRLSKDGKLSTGDISVIPTGALPLDIALGIGGLPRGRIVEIYGPESSGKTTLTLHAIAEAQRRGGVCAFIDAEHALDIGYARKIGVRTDDLLVSQPDFGEQALEICDTLVRSGAIDIIVVDSVAALTPKAELEGEMGDSHVGLQARLMSQALRKLTGSVARSRTMVIFINQLRMKIGVMFGSPETTTGGNALKFYASIRLDIRRIGAIKEGEQIVGNRTRVKVVKNKLAPPFREVEFDITYGEGVSREGAIIDLGVEDKVIEKSGAWLSYKGDRIGQGRENAKKFLRENPDICVKIEAEILVKHNIVQNTGTLLAAQNEAAGKPADKGEGKAKPDASPVKVVAAAATTVATAATATNGATLAQAATLDRLTIGEGGPAQHAASHKVQLASEAEVEDSVQRGRNQRETGRDVERRWRAGEGTREGDDGEPKPHGLGEPRRSLILQVLRCAEAGPHEAAEHPAPGLVAQAQQRARPEGEGLDDEQRQAEAERGLQALVAEEVSTPVQLLALHGNTVPTLLAVAPVIPMITDHELEAIVAAGAQAGARAGFYLPVRLPHEVAPLFRAWLDQHYPDRAGKVMATIRSMRGGRDNDPDFFTRMEGEGPWADLLRTRFAAACRKAGLGTDRLVLRRDLFQAPEGRQMRLL